MMQKPDTCRGCPMYGSGRGFVPDRLVPGCRLLILAQNPGKDEERGAKIVGYDGRNPVYESVPPQPLIGATGYALRETYLPLTGEHDASLCNLLKCRWKHSNALPTGSTLKAAVEHCAKAHLRIPDSAELIVAMGGPAFEFTQPALKKQRVSKEEEREKGGPITTWRGFIAPETYQGRPVFGVVHLADLFRDPTKRVPARLDWRRIGRYLRGTWPKSIPPRLVATDDVDALDRAFDEAEQAAFVAVDTEFDRITKYLSLVGIGWEIAGKVNGVQVEWGQANKATREVRAHFVRRFARLIKHVKVVFQNAKADLAVLDKNLHISWERAYTAGIEDTMHMHAVLWSEMPHSLEFLASIYGQYPKLKHLAHVDPLLYNWGDVIETIEVYKALTQELKADPLVERIYRTQSLPLITITLRRELYGIRVNAARREDLIRQYSAKVEAFQQIAHAYAGHPINLMSVGCDGQLATHLRVYDGIDLDSVDEETISTARDKCLPFNREHEERHGFTVEYVYDRIANGAHPLLELRAAAAHYSQVLNQDLLPIRDCDRVHPSLRHDAQASGRWSTTRPALAKVPNDLLDLYLPDEGKLLFGADFDAQEPRIFMAEAKSEYLKRAFDEGLDIHTMLVCDMFGWEYPQDLRDPHSSDVDKAWRERHGWGGKEDKRRTVAKNVRYERYYMGTGKNAIDKAVKLGLPKEAMLRASQLVIEQDSNVAEFHRLVRKLAKERRVRSWNGRLRVCLGTGASVEREACNHKMQAGGVDILNATVIEVVQTYPFVTLFYTRHDSFWFEIPESMFTRDLAEGIRRIAEQPRSINGMMVPFPASWKMMRADGRIEKYTFTG